MASQLGTSGARAEWGNRCATSAELTRHVFWNGTGITIRKGTEESWQALDAILKAYQWGPRKADTGAMVCRKITGGSGYSLHAMGIAADLSWNTNPYRKRPAGVTDCEGLFRAGLTDMPCDMVASIKRIQTKDGTFVFRWGGDYTKNVDAMHWEVLAPRKSLKGGIDWDTVDAEPPVPFDPKDPTHRPVLTQGSRGFHVENVQTAVGALGPDGKPDGAYGPGTAGKVAEWQKRMGLPADGTFDLADWEVLLGAKPAPAPKKMSTASQIAITEAEGEALTPDEIQFVKEMYAESVRWQAKPSSLFHVLRWFRQARGAGTIDGKSYLK